MMPVRPEPVLSTTQHLCVTASPVLRKFRNQIFSSTFKSLSNNTALLSTSTPQSQAKPTRTLWTRGSSTNEEPVATTCFSVQDATGAGGGK